MRVERPHVLEDLDQLEVIGGWVPGDQVEILHSWIVPTIGDELLEQSFRWVDEVGNDVDMRDYHDPAEIVALRRRTYQEYYKSQCRYPAEHTHRSSLLNIRRCLSLTIRSRCRVVYLSA